jgi:CheY-like chemotaxis protein
MKDQQDPESTRAEHEGATTEPATSRQADPWPVRVLVADDCETDRALAIWHLGKAWPFERGLVVERAVNGQEALERIQTSQFDLVVLDWSMPKLGGGDVLRRLRAEGRRIPVVVVSGMPREIIVHHLESMAAVFVHKDELNANSFRQAIAAAVQMPDVQWPGSIQAAPGA